MNAFPHPALVVAALLGGTVPLAALAADLQAGRYQLRLAASGLCLDSSAGLQLVQQSCSAASLAQQFDVVDAGDGKLRMLSAANGYAVGIQGGAASEGAAVILWPYAAAGSQQFVALRNGPGYLFRAAHSGKCMALKDWSLAKGGRQQQAECTGAANQSYEAVSVGSNVGAIADGSYRMRAVNSGLCVDVPGSTARTSVQLQQNSCNGTAAQQYELRRDQTDRYEIRNAGNGLCVDLRAGLVVDGNAIQQYACNPGNAQRWRLTTAGDGSFQIASALAPAKVWAVGGDATAPRAALSIASRTGGTNQRWLLEPVIETPPLADGAYVIRNIRSERCLEVPSSTVKPGVPLQQNGCTGSSVQRFRFDHVGKGFYRIANLGSGLAMQVAQFSLEDNAAIQQAEAHGGDNQLFLPVAHEDGYLLKSKSSSKCVSIASFSAVNGVGVQQSTCGGRDAQVFSLQSAFSTMAAAPPTVSARENSYPIVLVHGFSGWSRDEMSGLKYWGGGPGNSDRDIQEVLKAHGYPTFTGVVGPISSVRDRAVELFYQIKGGCVDYGPHHSTHLLKIDGSPEPRALIRKLDGGANADGTRRPRKCWAANPARNPNGDPLALYPEWGTAPDKKLHLIGHSLGAPTIRVLLHLLRNGDAAETGADADLLNESVQPNPYTGGKNWISSLTSVAGTLDGASGDGALLFSVFNGAASALAAVAGVASPDNLLYDFKLQQWGIGREAGETLTHYLKRAQNSPALLHSRNSALWDITPEAAAALNQQLNTFNDVYYFSTAGQSSWRDPLTGCHYPLLSTNALLMPISIYVGCRTVSQPGKVAIDSSWWPNDGGLNTRTGRAPTGAPSVDYNGIGAPTMGTWNYLGTRQGWDHADFIGLLSEKAPADVNALYLDHARRLRALVN